MYSLKSFSVSYNLCPPNSSLVFFYKYIQMQIIKVLFYGLLVKLTGAKTFLPTKQRPAKPTAPTIPPHTATVASRLEKDILEIERCDTCRVGLAAPAGTGYRSI